MKTASPWFALSYADVHILWRWRTAILDMLPTDAGSGPLGIVLLWQGHGPLRVCARQQQIALTCWRHARSPKPVREPALGAAGTLPQGRGQRFGSPGILEHQEWIPSPRSRLQTCTQHHLWSMSIEEEPVTSLMPWTVWSLFTCHAALQHLCNQSLTCSEYALQRTGPVPGSMELKADMTVLG